MDRLVNVFFIGHEVIGIPDAIPSSALCVAAPFESVFPRLAITCPEAKAHGDSLSEVAPGCEN